MAITLVNWEEIVETEEFQEEVEVITNLLVASLGSDMVWDATNPFIYTVAYLTAVHRYYIKHIPECGDIDTSPFIECLKKEIGADLPLTDAIPVVEFLREAKNFYSRKGTEVLFKFVGALINSAIEINYPRELVFRFSNPRSRLSGASSNHGILPFKQSKLARFAGGSFWTNWTYLVEVKDAQNMRHVEDLMNFLDHIHPAGTARFLTLIYTLVTGADRPNYSPIIRHFHKEWTWIQKKKYATFDNNWNFGSKKAKFSMHGGGLWNKNIDLIRAPRLLVVNSYRTLEKDSLTVTADPNDPGYIFSRKIPHSDGTYSDGYGDNDDLVAEAQTLNMSVSQATYGVHKDKTYRQVKKIAYGLDGKATLSWHYQMAKMNVIIT
jgi:hypothetical protein